jgi:hypothetical protein
MKSKKNSCHHEWKKTLDKSGMYFIWMCHKCLCHAPLGLVHLCYHMDKGCLTPINIALDVEIGKALKEIKE